MNKKNVPNRREMLIGAGLAAGALAATPAPAEAALFGGWDHEADIVVVGSGAAGCAAAATAIANGAKVIVVERMPILGGTTGKSGGVLWIPNNYVLREKGIDDKKEDCLRYIARFGYPAAYDPASPTLGLESVDYRVIEAFYDNGAAMVDKLRAQGAIKTQGFVLWGSRRPAPDYADHLPENKVPSGRSLEPAGGGTGGGAILIDMFETWLRAKGATILTEHRAKRLVMEGGRVIGLETETSGKPVRLKARRGVIFATGGYAQNPELLQLHQPPIYGSCARSSAQGDFLSIAGTVGARMGALGTAWRDQVILEQAMQNREVPLCVDYPPGDSMILVNKFGRRVVNEKRNYNDRSTIHAVFDPVAEEYVNRILVMVFDARTLDAYGGNIPLPLDARESPYIIEGGSLAELTKRIGARLAPLAPKTAGFALAKDFAAGLDATIERFNGFARSGDDKDFGRGKQAYDREWMGLFSNWRKGTKQPPNTMPNNTMHPIDKGGPFYAVLLGAGALDTSGGPMINERAEVLGQDMKPIPGLYGAGNCIASPTRRAYLGAGCTIGLAMTFGYIAANAASASA